MFSIILYPLKFLPIFGAIAAFLYMHSVKNSALAAPKLEEALVGKERVWVWLLSIISPVLAGAVFYFGWRKVLPKKAKQANLISFIVFGIWLLLVIFGVYQNWGLFTSFRESAYRQAREDSEKSLQGFERTTEGTIIDETANWKTYRNEKYGFEIKYPPGSQVLAAERTDLKNRVDILYYPTSGGNGHPVDGFNITIGVLKDSQTNPLQFAQEEYNGIRDELRKAPDRGDISKCKIESVRRGGVSGARIAVGDLVGCIDLRGMGTFLTIQEWYRHKDEIIWLIGGPIRVADRALFEQSFASFRFERDETANWKTYQNEEFDYEIRYPGGWSVVVQSTVAQPPNVEIQKRSKDSGDFSLIIEVVRSIFSAGELYQWQAQHGYFTSDDYSFANDYVPFRVGDRFATRAYYRPRAGGVPAEETFVVGDKRGMLHFTCLVSFEGYPDYTKYRSSGECDEMLKTFR